MPGQRVRHAGDGVEWRHTINDTQLLFARDRWCVDFRKIVQQQIGIAARSIKGCRVTRDECRRGRVEPRHNLIERDFHCARLSRPRFCNISLQ